MQPTLKRIYRQVSQSVKLKLKLKKKNIWSDEHLIVFH